MKSGTTPSSTLQARGAVRVARAYAAISSRATKNALLAVVEALRDKDRT
jgi:hypothetical protein